MRWRRRADMFPRLPRAARWTLRFVLLFPLVVFLLAAGRYLSGVNSLLRSALVPVATAEISNVLHREVKISGPISSVPGVLTIDDIAISSRRTFLSSKGEAAVRADRVTLRYDWRALLFDSGSAAHAIQTITLDRPDALIERFANSRYNFSDLLKPRPKKPGVKPFVAVIVAHDATLRFRDFLAPGAALKRPAFNRLTQAEATVDFSSERLVTWRGNGQGTGGRAAAVTVTGVASRTIGGRFRTDVTARNADAAYWAVYFKNFPQFRVTGGRGDLTLAISRLRSSPKIGPPVAPDLNGRLVLRDASVVVSRQYKDVLVLPVTGVSGIATFTRSEATFDGSLRLAGQTATASGTVFDFVRPQLAVTARASGVDVRRLARALPPLRVLDPVAFAPAFADIRFSGPLVSPQIRVAAAAPYLQFSGNRLTDAAALVFYADKIVRAPRLTGKLAGGTVTATLTADSRAGKPIVQTQGEAKNVDLALLNLPPGLAKSRPELGGRGNVVWIGDSRNRPLTLTANVTIARPKVRKTILTAARGRVVWTPNKSLTLAKAVLTGADGAATISGALPIDENGPHYNLAVSATGVELTRLLAPYTKLDIGGRASFAGKITGPPSEPTAVGTLRLFAARYGRYGLDTARGIVAASLDRVKFEDVILRRDLSEARLSGVVGNANSGNPAFNLDVKLSQGDVQDFLALATSVAPPRPKSSAGKAVASALPTLTGTASGAFHLGGTLEKPTLAGSALVTDATIADPNLGAYRIDRASARLAYRGDTLRLDNGVLLFEGTQATARGTWSRRSGALSGIFASDALDLSIFRRKISPFADVSGHVNVSGQISGTAASPKIAFGVVTDGLRVNRQNVAQLSLFGRYDDGVITQNGDPWRITLEPENAPPVRYVLDDLWLTLPTPAHPGRTASLALTASVPEDAPERVSHVVETLRQALENGPRLAESPAGRSLASSLASLPAPLEGMISVPSVTVRGPLSALQISGSLNARDLAVDKNTVKTLTVNRLSLALGVRPAFRLDAAASNISVAGYAIDRAAAAGGFANRVLTVTNFRADSGDYAVFLEPGSPAVVNLDGETDVNLEASNVPLALLGSRFGRAIDGRLDASVALSGPTRAVGSFSIAPDLQASVTIKGLDLRGSPSEKGLLYAVRAPTISLAGPRDARLLTVTDLAAYKTAADGATISGPPVATVSGSLPVSAVTPSSAPPSVAAEPFVASIRDLSILHLFVPGLDPNRTSGALTAQLSLRGAPTPDNLTGVVQISEATLGIIGADTALEKINGSVRLEKGRAIVESLRAAPMTTDAKTGKRRGGGGTVAVTGSAPLGPEAGNWNLKLGISDALIEETTALKAYSSFFRGKISGNVTMDGPFRTPTLSSTSASSASKQAILVTEASGTIPSGLPDPLGTIAPQGPQVVVAVPGGANGAKRAASARTAALDALRNLDGLRGGDEYVGLVARRGRSALRRLGLFAGGVTLTASARPGTPGVVDVVYAASLDAGFDPKFQNLRVQLGTSDRTVSVRDGGGLLRAETRGAVNFNGSLSLPVITAALELPRGQFFLPPSTRLTFVQPTGELDLRYDATAPGDDPTLQETIDLTAQATVTASQADLAAVSSVVQGGVGAPSASGQSGGSDFNRPQRYVITVGIRGPLDNPNALKLTPTSSPPGLSEAQMFAALTQQGAYANLLAGGSGAENALKQQIGLAFNAFVLPTLFQPIETGVAQTFGLSSFSVDYAPDSPVSVTLSKELFPRLEVTYIRLFGSRNPGAVNSILYQPQYRVKLGYTIRRRFQISVSTDDQRNNTLALEGVFGF